MLERLFPPLTQGAPFRMFGATHLWALGLTAVACVLAAFAGARPKGRGQLRTATALGLIIIGYELFKIALMSGWYGSPLREELPLHLCRFAEVCAGIMLITRSRALFEPVYFWTFAAGLPANLTPDLIVDFPHPMFTMFFVTHGASMVAVSFAIAAFDFRIDFGSFRRGFLWTLALFLTVFPLNFLIGSNYMYLMKKPEGDTIYNLLGPWPWYILSLAGLAITVMLLLYGFFKVGEFIARLVSRRPAADAETSTEIAA